MGDLRLFRLGLHRCWAEVSRSAKYFRRRAVSVGLRVFSGADYVDEEVAVKSVLVRFCP